MEPTPFDEGSANRAFKLLWPAIAALLSAPVNLMELSTLTEPGVTLLMVTLVTTLSLAKMLASRVLMNCTQQT